ncbi:MAG: hypothetical protein JSU00_22790 [Acidobacteria bacterium]|nr:hypothetical protein [Acidobacteriota bacterium]
MPNCIPVVPALPDEAYYPVARLYLVPTFDRNTYRSTFGEDAPTYDGARKTKTWFDSTAIQNAGSPDAMVQYTVIERDLAGNVTPKSITMTAREAATVNLYGIHSYSQYQIAPTKATTEGIGALINPVNLCLQSDAIALAKSFGLDASAVSESPLSIVYPAGELRRLWLIQYKGFQLTAGTLLFEMNQNGAGAPGHWNLDGGEPNWISDLPSSLPPQNPAWGTPCRPLQDVEAISVNPFGFMIYRKDRASVYTQSSTAAPAVTLSTGSTTPSAATTTTTTGTSTTTAPASTESSATSDFLARLEQNLLSLFKSALIQTLSQQK